MDYGVKVTAETLCESISYLSLHRLQDLRPLVGSIPGRGRTGRLPIHGSTGKPHRSLRPYETHPPAPTFQGVGRALPPIPRRQSIGMPFAENSARTPRGLPRSYRMLQENNYPDPSLGSGHRSRVARSITFFHQKPSSVGENGKGSESYSTEPVKGPER